MSLILTGLLPFELAFAPRGYEVPITSVSQVLKARLVTAVEDLVISHMELDFRSLEVLLSTLELNGGKLEIASLHADPSLLCSGASLAMK